MPTGVLLLVSVIYCLKHRGSDSPGVVLGICLGVAGADGMIGTLAGPVIQVIDSVCTAIIGIASQWVPGGGPGGDGDSGTTTTTVAVLRYQLGLFGIGR